MHKVYEIGVLVIQFVKIAQQLFIELPCFLNTGQTQGCNLVLGLQTQGCNLARLRLVFSTSLSAFRNQIKNTNVCKHKSKNNRRCKRYKSWLRQTLVLPVVDKVEVSIVDNVIAKSKRANFVLKIA